MTSRRDARIAGYSVLAGMAVVVLVTAACTGANGPFGPHSLDGSYHFSVSEIRVEAPLTVYCNSYGIIEFDGAGSAEIPDGTAEGWCRDADGNPLPDDPVEPGCFTYDVSADGRVIITELTDPPACGPRPAGKQYTTHCQILDRGKLLLCDGTGGGGDIPPERLLWSATAGAL